MSARRGRSSGGRPRGAHRQGSVLQARRHGRELLRPAAGPRRRLSLSAAREVGARYRARMSLEPAAGGRWRRWGPWLAAAAIAVAGLAVGFGVGRVTDEGGTTTVTVATTTPAPATPPRPPAAAARSRRRRVRLVVLNGTEVTGLAGRTAARARRLGYRRVAVGNGPRVAGRDQTWFRAGYRAAAAQAVRDFRTAPGRRLVAGSPLLAQV